MDFAREPALRTEDDVFQTNLEVICPRRSTRHGYNQKEDDKPDRTTRKSINIKLFNFY